MVRKVDSPNQSLSSARLAFSAPSGCPALRRTTVASKVIEIVSMAVNLAVAIPDPAQLLDVTPKFEYYEVRGRSLRALVDQIRLKKFGGSSSNTRFNVSFHCELGWTETPCPSCKRQFHRHVTVGHPELDISIVVTHPLWNRDDEKAVGPAVRKEWARFFTAVWMHERTHVELDVSQFDKAREACLAALQKAEGVGCSDASQDDADRLAKEEIHKNMQAIVEKMIRQPIQKLNDDFDAKTDHGVKPDHGPDKDKAELNLKVICP